MKILAEKPHSLRDRHAPDSVVIHCGCGEDFLWERRLGPDVKCPKCEAVEKVEMPT